MKYSASSLLLWVSTVSSVISSPITNAEPTHVFGVLLRPSHSRDFRVQLYQCGSTTIDDLALVEEEVNINAARDPTQVDATPAERILRVASRIWATKLDEGQFARRWAEGMCPRLVGRGENQIYKQFLGFAYAAVYGPTLEYPAVKAIINFDKDFRKKHNMPRRRYIKSARAPRSNMD